MATPPSSCLVRYGKRVEYLDAYVNDVDADLLARGISKADPARAAIAAGRVLLEHLRKRAAKNISVAFEITLASRSFAVWISDLLKPGWNFDLVFLWPPNPHISVAGVQGRVDWGGHGVPEDVLGRPYRSASHGR